ncbi:hypothetical protein [Streptomyces sp. SCUT-3]|uniref:hypothetical protein n=1 Tax=Streptomyces sp. SCUT-3 TaxID=2684469 RepID=UPI0031FCC6F3
MEQPGAQQPLRQQPLQQQPLGQPPSSSDRETGPGGAAALVAVWEAGLAAGPAGRALLLHGFARPHAAVDELLRTPVGRRDADLFALRRSLFGDLMDVRVACGECAEEMEFGFDPAGVVGEAGVAGAAGAAGSGNAGGSAEADAEPLTVEADGWEVRFVPPAAADVAAAEEAGPDRARAVLLSRTVLSAGRDGAPVRPEDLPGPVQERMARAAAEADPCADVVLNVPCPECGSTTRAELDIASYLWAEVDAWARTALADVHLLATAYGWSEAEILALSPLRRRYYLELCADA